MNIAAVLGSQQAQGEHIGLDAIRSGHVVLIAHTRTAAEMGLVRDVIGDSVALLPDL